MTGVLLAGAVALLFALWRAGRRLRFFLHVLQLEGYRTGALLAWTVRRPTDVLFRLSHALGVVLMVAALLWEAPGAQVLLLLLWAATFASSRRYRRDRPKKPLAATPRLRRLAAVAALPPLALAAWGLVAALAPGGPPAAATLVAGLWLADLGAPLWAALAGVLLAPVERRIHEGFKDRARRRLAERPDLVVVAVTGSYGKTSVKFMIAEMLARRYNVLATPGSFNTPMGICRVINDQLRPEHQVMVLEMGIRHPGDIAELCGIARPHVAVITGVGVAHLESMGSEQAIADEKGSLLDFLLSGGTAVLNADDAWYREHRARATGPVVGVSASGLETADLRATDVRFGPGGTACTVFGGDGRPLGVTLRLLGRHNVGNMLLGLAVARALGVRPRQAALAAAGLEPVPHRLALRREGALLVLDDAFNSNPVGAQSALEVLGQFPGRRFVVTPGMIELGEREEAENEAFGAAMQGRVDEVYLVGPERTRAIARGLRGSGFPEERVHVVHTLFEARDAVRRSATDGDVVLYENDLPDQYTEA
jgi:UDP-N-acetylmuramoyl-tripeptide--D-alanyl-D-alanine ligase